MYWISPRGWLALISCWKILALMDWRDFVIPEDIKNIALDALSHRIVLSYDAIANDISQNQLIKQIIDWVKVV
jgi:MoxR-like ATPase